MKKYTKTALARENYVYHAVNLLNKIPPEILAEEKKLRFKKRIKAWIKEEIPVKP